MISVRRHRLLKKLRSGLVWLPGPPSSPDQAREEIVAKLNFNPRIFDTDMTDEYVAAALADGFRDDVYALLLRHMEKD